MSEQTKTELEERKLRAEIEQIELSNEIARTTRDERAADEKRARILPFVSDVNPMSARSAIATLGDWYRQDAERPIEIIFNSPGGYVFDGFALFDFLELIRGGGTYVTTRILGYAASMAGILTQAGTERTISPRSRFMIHEVGSGAYGKTSAMRDEVELCEKLEDDGFAILASRATISEEEIRERCRRRDWWLDAEDALKYGFVDRIV